MDDCTKFPDLGAMAIVCTYYELYTLRSILCEVRHSSASHSTQRGHEPVSVSGERRR